MQSVLGMNFRAYDPVRQKWNIHPLNALTGTWTDLGLGEFGGSWSSLGAMNGPTMARPGRIYGH